jgi:hypothetical protein
LTRYAFHVYAKGKYLRQTKRKINLTDNVRRINPKNMYQDPLLSFGHATCGQTNTSCPYLVHVMKIKQRALNDADERSRYYIIATIRLMA